MRNLIYIILSLLFFISCQHDDTSSVAQGGKLLVPVNLPFQLLESFPAAEESSSLTNTRSLKVSPFSVSYSPVSSIQTKASTTFSNVWVLQFNSVGTCVKATNLGTVSTTNINPTLVSGSGYTIYVIANGPSASNAFSTSTTQSSLESSLAYSESIISDVPYIGKLDNVTISVDGVLNSGSSQAPTLTLTRIAAKVSLTLNYNVSGYTLQSVEMYNASRNMYYLNGSSTSVFPEASTTNINQSGLAATIVSSTATNGTYVWYVGENKRGANAAITSPYNKDFLHTPTTDNSYYYCTYIRIKALKNDGSGRSLNYYVYPGLNSTSNFNVVRNYDYNLNVMVQGNAASQESMEGVDGRVRMETSNCYTVTPGGTITIPVNIKGNGNQPLTEAPADNSIIGGVTHSTSSIGVLWQTSPGLITNISSIYNGKVNVTVSSSSGNAVIAAYNASGTILWSWHIWVTNYAPLTKTNGTTYAFNNYTWMDRNLGATSTTPATVSTLGMTYQWGRKDPFSCAGSVLESMVYTSIPIYNSSGTELTELAESTGTGVKHVLTSAPNNLLNSIQNPLTFYYSTADMEWDWYTSTKAHNKTLWGADNLTSPGYKTIYDPCPAGWRVPYWKSNLSPWNNLTISNFVWADYGRSSSSTGYFPATGYRYAGTGAFTEIGERGLYWTSTSLTTICAFDFGSSFVTPEYPNQRSHAFSVRCVKE